MKYADPIALSILHLALIGFLVKSIWVQIRISLTKWKERKRRTVSTLSANLSVNRGEQSMNAIYVFYGATTVIFSLAIQSADFLIGCKSALIIIDYSILSYLFFSMFGLEIHSFSQATRA